MNFSPLYRIVLTLAFIAVFPLLLSAEGRTSINLSEDYENQAFLVFQDSIQPKRPDTRPKNAPDSPPRETKDERFRNQGRRSIKQVPRSVPKLKPQPVPDGINIRRPPAPTNTPRTNPPHNSPPRNNTPRNISGASRF